MSKVVILSLSDSEEHLLDTEAFYLSVFFNHTSLFILV